MHMDLEIARVVALPYLRARLAADERGASMVEYALVLALIAVVGVVGLTFLGRSAGEKLTCSGVAIDDAPVIPDDATSPGDYYNVDGVAGYLAGKDVLVTACD